VTLLADHLRALRILAGSPNGCAEVLLSARGVSTKTMVELVKAGYATMRTDRVRARGKAIEVTTVTITPAGREAIGG